MTELEQKAEEYLKELGKKKIPFSITNAHNCIKQAYKDGYEQVTEDFQNGEKTVFGMNVNELYNIRRENAELSNSVTELTNSKTELEKENAELKAELEKWKTEWHEQVIKANDEGYARTLQGIEIEKLKAQIEKMAICLNCKNGSDCQLKAEVHKLDFDPFGKCDKWELK